MKKLILIALGVMLAATSLNAQTNERTTSDMEIIRQRPCRMGTVSPQFTPRRAPFLRKDENPYIGERHQMVVMASFQDRDFKTDHETTLETWNKIFNMENYAEDGYYGSVHDYFYTQSGGKFDLTFDLFFVELPDSSKKYRSTNVHDEYSQYMVDDIVDVLQTQDIDWEQYDWDGDSFVDQLLIIFAGEGMNASANSNTIWPHQWWLSLHLNMETDDPSDTRSYRTFTSGDKEYHIDCYCCVQERVNYSGLKTSFGTICHEYTHCFGIPDFYFSDNSVLGSWDVMDNGVYNDRGFRPCNYSAHERMVMGWMTPIELTEGATITEMPAMADDPQAYLIRNDGAENEFYIVENRQKHGWDEFLPASGIIIFHIDYDEEIWTTPNLFPNNFLIKHYCVFSANNKTSFYSQSGWAYPFTNTTSGAVNDELTNTSQPSASLNNANVDGQKLMSKPITQMSVDADGRASFVFMDGGSSSIHPSVMADRQSSTHDTWYLPDGRRLSGKPTTPGLYLHNGQKVILQ